MEKNGVSLREMGVIIKCRKIRVIRVLEKDKEGTTKHVKYHGIDTTAEICPNLVNNKNKTPIYTARKL